MKTKIAVTLIILTCALNAQSLDLSAKSWSLVAGIGQQPGKLYNTNDGLAFTFGTYQSGQWLAYLTTKFRHPASYLQTQVLTMTVRITTITGNPIFRYDSESFNTCVYPAHIRPYFTTGKLYGADLTRWWSNPVAIEIVSGGTYTINVSFDPANWSSVYGQFGNQHPTEYAYALANVTYIGATLGGGCFFGHGVCTDNGTAMLEVLDYEIQ